LIFLLLITDDDKNFISEIFEKYHKRMLYTASQILGIDRGEEAVHDVFVKILDRIEKNPDFLRDKVGQYFVIMVKNHSITLLNRDKAEIFSFDEEISDTIMHSNLDRNPEDSLLKKEIVERLAIYITQMSPETRQVLEYRFIEGYRNTEIAEILGISQSAVSSRLDRGKVQLKKLLMEGGIDNVNG